MYCPKCGKEMNEGAAFCPQCGNPLSALTPKIQPKKRLSKANKSSSQPKENLLPPKNDPVQKPKKPRKWLICLIVIAIMITICIAAVIIIQKIDQNKKLSRFDFPVNDESIDVMKSIQGEWNYSEFTEDIEYEISISFQGENEYSKNSRLRSLMADTDNSESGTFSIDTEKDVIYIIPNDFDYFDPVREPGSVIYDYNSITGECELFYNGYQLTHY